MVIDVNMHALPENSFQDEALLQAFLRIVPQAYRECAKLVAVPGTDKRQIVIEKPRGYANLNFSQNAVDVGARLEISAEEKEQILCGNARRLFGIK